VVHISAGNNHIVGMTEDGLILCAGGNGKGQCNFRGALVQYPSGGSRG